MTGLVIALFTLGITYIGGWGFRFFCFCIGGVILYEWNGIIKSQDAPKAVISSWIFYIALGAACLSGARSGCIAAVLGIGLAASFLLALLSSRMGRSGVRSALVRAGGLLYAALFPLCLPYLRDGAGRGDAAGLCWVIFLYIAVWATDIGAYLFGRALGGPKLAPRISPNKTWSGACGGVLCSVTGALCFLLWAKSGAPFFLGGESGAVLSGRLLIPAAFLLSLVAQAGDLLESRFKRRFGIKDSGYILPGHGGIMDRVDGLVPAAAVFAVLLDLFPL